MSPDRRSERPIHIPRAALKTIILMGEYESGESVLHLPQAIKKKTYLR